MRRCMEYDAGERWGRTRSPPSAGIGIWLGGDGISFAS